MKFASNASKLHKKVGITLEETPPFKGSLLKQEVPVSELFPNYPNNRDRYDWVAPKLKVIIECHGIQHYKFQTFGEDAELALMKWKEGLVRDERKKQVAIESGWTFIEVPYTDEKVIDGAYLVAKYLENLNEEEVPAEKLKAQDWVTKRKQEQRELARSARKERYNYLKGLKEKYKNDGSN